MSDQRPQEKVQGGLFRLNPAQNPEPQKATIAELAQALMEKQAPKKPNG